MKKLNLSGNHDYRYLSAIIKELIEDGRIKRVKNKLTLVIARSDTTKQSPRVIASAVKQSKKTVISTESQKSQPQKSFPFTAILQSSNKGYAFAVVEGADRADVFIPASKLNGAAHGDKVSVRVTEPKENAGEVAKILQRGVESLVGTYCKLRRNGFVLADDKRFSNEYLIENKNSNCAQNGQKVVIKILDYNIPSAQVLEVLGYPDDKGIDILSIIRSYGLYEEFPKKVCLEAAAVAKEVAVEAGRCDFCQMKTITIDGADAKDLDDAVSCEYDAENKIYTLYVHIADVAHYVKHGFALDKEAYKRGTSVYFPDRVLPMLPKELSNGICSLNPDEDRLALSAIIKINSSGETADVEICESIINSNYRMTYDEVEKIFTGKKELKNKYSEISDELKIMQKLAALLRKKRFKRGSVDFEIPECKVVLDANGKAADIRPYPRYESHRLIEEFMLKANECVAEFFCRKKLPFVYRIHEKPSPEKMSVFSDFLSALGISHTTDTENPTPLMFSRLFDNLKDSELLPTVSKVALRSMQKARYFPQNIGHFGLAAKYYCHFTSPIRRYPDLLIHRIIKDYLHEGEIATEKYKNFVSDAAENSSLQEKAAEEAEREVENLKKAEYMAAHIGESYDAIICGVTEYGIFAELKNTCEGLIRLENLPEDEYTYYKAGFKLRGKSHIYSLGDKIKITVKSANLETRKVEFTACHCGCEALSKYAL